MATHPSILEHALDLLAPVGPLRARAMFGGHGVYARGVMFALIYDDELYLRSDASTRPRFAAAGCEPFVYAGRRGEVTMPFHRPPDDANESAEAMLPWAQAALEAALRARVAKAARAGAGVARKATRRRAPKPPRRRAARKAR